MRNKKLIWIFIIIEIVCYAAFLTLDIIGGFGFISNIIKLSAISICFLFVAGFTITHMRLYGGNLLQERSGGDMVMLSIILAFTVFSDVFLLFSKDIVIGLISFCAVQFMYLVWLSYMSKRLPKKGALASPVREHAKVWRNIFFEVLCRVILTLLICIILRLVSFSYGNSFELFFVVFYAVSFLGNIFKLVCLIISRRWRDGAMKLNILLLGLILFILCDINVGLYNLSGTMSIISQTGHQLTGIAMWLFYLPSQVLIIMSAGNYFSGRS